MQNKRSLTGSNLVPPAYANAFRFGWNDKLANAPFSGAYEKASEAWQRNYEQGRLLCSRAIAAKISVPRARLVRTNAKAAGIPPAIVSAIYAMYKVEQRK